MNKEEKIQEVSGLHESFSKAKAVIVTDFRGLKVEEMNELRKRLKAASVEFRVVKNTLAQQASVGTSVEKIKDKFVGPVGLAMSFDDPVAAPKALIDFMKKKEEMKIKFGVVEGSPIDPEEIKTIADLPPRKVVMSRLLSGLQSPARRMAEVLYSLIARFSYALESVKGKKSMSE